MRKLFLFLAIVFLLQSCFSYKAMDNDSSKMETGKTYKIKQYHKFSKIVFHTTKDSIILVSKDFKEQQIPIKDITNIKKRKFSIIKTAASPLTVAAVLIGLFALTYDGPSTGEISFNK